MTRELMAGALERVINGQERSLRLTRGQRRHIKRFNPSNSAEDHNAFARLITASAVMSLAEAKRLEAENDPIGTLRALVDDAHNAIDTIDWYEQRFGLPTESSLHRIRTEWVDRINRWEATIAEFTMTPADFYAEHMGREELAVASTASDSSDPASRVCSSGAVDGAARPSTAVRASTLPHADNPAPGLERVAGRPGRTTRT